MGVYLAFVRAVGVSPVVLVFLSVLIYSGLNVYSNFWLTFWTEDSYLKNMTLTNTTTYHDKYTMYLGVFTALVVGQGNIYCTGNIGFIHPYGTLFLKFTF